jgi:hypothetical protein
MGQTEEEAWQALYGSHTRSGRVTKTWTYRWGNFDWVGDWPRIPACAGSRTCAEFQKGAVLREGESFSFRVELGAFGTTVRV